MRSLLLRLPLAVLLLLLPACGGTGPETDRRISTDGETVRVDISEVREKGFSFYAYVDSSGKQVDFFVYRDSSGTVRAALDACRKCYRWRRGYSFESGEVACRRCGERFEIDGLSEGRGSCTPIPLPSVTERDTLLIPVTALEEGAKYF